ncbi:hypothetical protein K432DRAFT_381347 [Lepidopterella palustris CBS 459.81]|uniref:Uncharacterized protein n=1 Tax=Lepidopterella palustris CBS 459.81 TaxID=1314670 RepID=A0A8E2EC82_9PEZI|nr:hypothetical protein K432DRAFT_381347 [Lepidopterella palustris CBS 459.81]
MAAFRTLLLPTGCGHPGCTTCHHELQFDPRTIANLNLIRVCTHKITSILSQHIRTQPTISIPGICLLSNLPKLRLFGSFAFL